MKNNLGTIVAAVLAAGKGKRIGHHLPKVLYPIMGKPMLYYTLELIEKIPIKNTYVVVGSRAIDVKASLRNEKVDYVFQKDQLGTGHAADLVLSNLTENVTELIVFNGDDSAFFEVGTIRNFINNHKSSNSKISFITATVENSFGLGRVLRDENNSLLKIVEEKDATEKERKIKEVNVGCYILDKEWARKAIKLLTKSNSGEYYITDLIYLALRDNQAVSTYSLDDNDEWRGVNTQDELKGANERMLVKLKKRKEPTVFLFDIDNTIINTDAVKEYINENLVGSVIKPELLGEFWNEYETIRQSLGFISIPDLSDSFAERMRDPIYSEKIRDMFYTIPFEKFVYKGIDELMEYIDPKGEIAVLTEGDLVYQPMKIKNLSISKYLDEMYVFENKKDNFGNIGEIYKNRRMIVIDDKLPDLENFKKINGNSLVIHLKQGVYQNLPPKNLEFEADFSAPKIGDLLNYIKSLY